MPKVQYINPDHVRKSGQIEFAPIPVNQYNKTIEEEKENFSKFKLGGTNNSNGSPETAPHRGKPGGPQSPR